MGMEMKSGRNFSREFPSDSTAIVINESAAKRFGFKNPIGEKVSSFAYHDGVIDNSKPMVFTVIGVVSDFHFESLKQNITPLCLQLGESGWDTISESPFGIGGPAGMDPAVVKTLHDGFRKVLEDPALIAALDKFYMPAIYMNTADYTSYAERTFLAEKATVERLGLAKKS
jgi:hypothetical protein